MVVKNNMENNSNSLGEDFIQGFRQKWKENFGDVAEPTPNIESWLLLQLEQRPGVWFRHLCDGNGATHYKVTFYKDNETVAETPVIAK